MKRSHLGKSTLILTLVLVALSAGAAQAQEAVNFQWTAPTTGAAVDHYVIEHSVNSSAWNQIGTSSTNTFTLTATVGDSHRIRVAAVDADSRQGLFSESSAAYVPQLDPPGQPGQPIVF